MSNEKTLQFLSLRINNFWCDPTKKIFSHLASFTSCQATDSILVFVCADRETRFWQVSAGGRGVVATTTMATDAVRTRFLRSAVVDWIILSHSHRFCTPPAALKRTCPSGEPIEQVNNTSWGHWIRLFFRPPRSSVVIFEAVAVESISQRYYENSCRWATSPVSSNGARNRSFISCA
jgi:hypothetical protein